MLSIAPAGTVCAQTSKALGRATALITPDEVRRHVFILADDSMRGRATPSPELEEAAQYIAAEFRMAGLRPSGDAGSYFQRYPMERVRVFPESSGVGVTGPNRLVWTYGKDYAFPFNDWADATAEGDVVVLLGSLAASAQFDTTSLKGRVLLIPGGTGVNYLRVAGWHPAAVLHVTNEPDSLIARYAAGFATPKTRRPGGGPFPMPVITDRAVAELTARFGIDLNALRSPPADSMLRAILLPNDFYITLVP